MSYLIGQIIGALLLTLLVSRFSWWTVKRWRNSPAKLIYVHGSTLLALTTVRSLGEMDGGPYSWLDGISWSVTMAQIGWAIYDFMKGRAEPPEDEDLDTVFS